MTASGDRSRPDIGGMTRRTGFSNGSLMTHKIFPAGLFTPGPTQDRMACTNSEKV